MYNSLSIYQTKYYENIRYLLYHAQPLRNISIVPVAAKQHYYANKPTIITALLLNWQKPINICYCSFNEVSVRRKNSASKKFDLTIHFELMINF